MRILFVLILHLFSSISYALEDCSPDALKLKAESNIAEKLYYTGTCHYRNKEYEKSVKLWQKIASMETLDTGFKDLKSDVLNNLGYLMFYGLGISQDKNKAIECWKKAILMGQTESEFHLCHAFADESETTFDRDKAVSHCKKALYIYRGMDNKDEDIINTIQSYYEGVK